MKLPRPFTNPSLERRLNEITALPIQAARMIVRDFQLDVLTDREMAREEGEALRAGIVAPLGEMQRQHEEIVTLLSLLRLDRASNADLRSLSLRLQAHLAWEAELNAELSCAPR